MGKILVYLQANKLACNSIMGHEQKNSEYWGREKDSYLNTEDSISFTFKPVPFVSLFPHRDEEVTSWILHVLSVCITSLGSWAKKTLVL